MEVVKIGVGQPVEIYTSSEGLVPVVPYVGANKNWWVGDHDTGILAEAVVTGWEQIQTGRTIIGSTEITESDLFLKNIYNTSQVGGVITIPEEVMGVGDWFALEIIDEHPTIVAAIGDVTAHNLEGRILVFCYRSQNDIYVVI